MRSLTRSLATTLLLAILAPGAACSSSSDDEDGGSFVTVLSPGAGVENTEPLWPIRPGWMTQDNVAGLPAQTNVVLEPRTIGGRKVFPYANATRGNFEAIGVPSEPGPVKFLSVDEAGVWLAGQPREGLLARGALLVPTKVRVGMKWQSTNRGATRMVVEVTGREEQDTIFGRRPVWTLRFEDHGRWFYEGPDLADSPRRSGRVTTLRFIEGRGPLDALRGLDPWQDRPAGHVVVPLEDPVVASGEAPRVQLQPMNGGQPVAEGALVLRATAWEDPARPDRMTVHVQTVSAGFAVGGPGGSLGTVVVGAEGIGGGCALVTGDTFSPVENPREDCIPGDAVLFAQGKRITLPFLEDGRTRQEQDCPERSTTYTCYEEFHHFRGLVLDKAGVPRALSWRHDPWRTTDFPGMLQYGKYVENHSVDGLRDYVEPPLRFPTFLPFVGARPHRRGGAAPALFFWTAVQDDDSVAIAHVDAGRGRIAFGRAGTPPLVHSEHWVYPYVETSSVFTRGAERSYFLVGYDGLVRRVLVERDGLRFQNVAAVDVPPGEILTAAFVRGDELIAFTQRGFRGIDPWYTPTGIQRHIFTELGAVHAWRAKLPPAPEPTRPGSVFGIEATALEADVRVCWAPGYGPVSLDGWMLAGEAPALVRSEGPDDHCVLLVRKTVTDLTQLDRPGAWSIEGPIPGAGRAAIGMTSASWRRLHADTSNTGVWDHPSSMIGALTGAPLKEGGVASLAAHFGPGYMRTRDRDDLNTTIHTREGRTAIDRAGNGLWAYPGASGFPEVALLGRNEVKIIPLGSYYEERKDKKNLRWDVHPIAADGGGVMLGDLHVGADGTIRVLPAPADPPDLSPTYPMTLRRTALLADGTQCGVKEYRDTNSQTRQRIWCLPPFGPERQSEPIADAAEFATPEVATGNHAWQLGLGLDRLSFTRIDLTTFEVTTIPTDFPLDRTSKVSVTSDPSGTKYVAASTLGNHRILKLTDEGPTPVALEELALFRNAHVVDLVVESDMFLLIARDQNGVREAHDETKLAEMPPEVVRVPRNGR